MKEQAQIALEQRKARNRQLALAFQRLFESSDGEQVLKKLSEMCNENEPTFVDQNPTGSAYKEGQRSIILGIRKMLSKNIHEIKQASAKV